MNSFLYIVPALIFIIASMPGCKSTHCAQNVDISDVKKIAYSSWLDTYNKLGIVTCVHDKPMCPSDVILAENIVQLDNKSNSIKEIKFHRNYLLTGIIWINLDNHMTYQVIHDVSAARNAKLPVLPCNDQTMLPIVDAVSNFIGGGLWGDAESSYFKIGFDIPGFAHSGDLICDMRWVAGGTTYAVIWFTEGEDKMIFLYLPKKVRQDLGWATTTHLTTPAAPESNPPLPTEPGGANHANGE
jgi:hypothetical protein